MTYFGNGGSEHNNLIEFAHTLHELVHARPFDHIDIVVLTFNFDWYGKVSLSEYLGARQHLYLGIVWIQLTLKLLCTSVSSKSNTRHFFPLNSGLSGPRRYFCCGLAMLLSEV
jgi:hypothetical protein